MRDWKVGERVSIVSPIHSQCGQHGAIEDVRRNGERIDVRLDNTELAGGLTPYELKLEPVTNHAA